MAVSIISSDNQNNTGKINTSNSSLDLPFKNYPNYIQIAHFVLGKDDADGGTPKVIKNLIKKFEGKTGYLDWTNLFKPKNSYLDRYYEMSKSEDSTGVRKGPFVLLDGFADQPLNIATSMNWENNTIETLLSSLASGVQGGAEKLKDFGNTVLATKSGGGAGKAIGAFAAMGGKGAESLVGGRTGKDLFSLFTTGSTGWTTTKLPTGGNHLMLNINLRKYDLIGDGSPLDMANLLSIFCSPLKSLASIALDAVSDLGDSAEAERITQAIGQVFNPVNNFNASKGPSTTNDTSVIDQVIDPTFVWNKYVVSVITNYKKIGSTNSSNSKTGDVSDDDKIILLPMVITQFNYTPSDNMIVLSDGTVGPAYIEYQLSLSSLMIMSNDDLDDLLVYTKDNKPDQSSTEKAKSQERPA